MQRTPPHYRQICCNRQEPWPVRPQICSNRRKEAHKYAAIGKNHGLYDRKYAAIYMKKRTNMHVTAQTPANMPLSRRHGASKYADRGCPQNMHTKYAAWGHQNMQTGAVYRICTPNMQHGGIRICRQGLSTEHTAGGIQICRQGESTAMRMARSNMDSPSNTVASPRICTKRCF